MAKLTRILSENKEWAFYREMTRIPRKYRTSDFEPMCYFPNHQ